MQLGNVYDVQIKPFCCYNYAMRQLHPYADMGIYKPNYYVAEPNNYGAICNVLNQIII